MIILLNDDFMPTRLDILHVLEQYNDIFVTFS